MSKKTHREAARLLPIGKSGIEECRAIVRECQYRKINEVMVDGWSASIIVQVYDAISDTNKAKLEQMPVSKAARICMAVSSPKKAA